MAKDYGVSIENPTHKQTPVRDKSSNKAHETNESSGAFSYEYHLEQTNRRDLFLCVFVCMKEQRILDELVLTMCITRRLDGHR